MPREIRPRKGEAGGAVDEAIVKEIRSAIASIIRVVEELYVYRYQKEIRFGIDLVARLKAISLDVGQEDEYSKWYEDLKSLALQLRDHHFLLRIDNGWLRDNFPGRTVTNSQQSPTDSRNYAYLPFRIEQYWKEGENATYVVTSYFGESEVYPQAVLDEDSQVIDQRDGILDEHPPFKEGVNVVSWNGMRIDGAVEENARTIWGSTQSPFLEQGLEYLTFRPFSRINSNRERQIAVGYRPEDDANGREYVALFRWRDHPQESSKFGTESSVNEESLVLREFFAKKTKSKTDVSYKVLRSRSVLFLRIFLFPATADLEFVDGAIEALKKEAKKVKKPGVTHIVLDLRDNPGGSIACADQLLNRLTGGHGGTRLRFRASSAINELTRYESYTKWRPSTRDSISSNLMFTAAKPLVQSQESSRKPKVQPRGALPIRVSVLVSALTESAAEMLAARVSDENHGTVFGTHARTAGAGGNIWPYDAIQRCFPDDQLAFEVGEDDQFMEVVKKHAVKLAKVYGLIANGPQFDFLKGPFSWSCFRETNFVGDRTLELAENMANSVARTSLSDREEQPVAEIRWDPAIDSRLLMFSWRDRSLSKFPSLPKWLTLSVPVRAAIRSNGFDGLDLEDRGVRVLEHNVFRPTSTDVFSSNENLRRRVADRLIRELAASD